MTSWMCSGSVGSDILSAHGRTASASHSGAAIGNGSRMLESLVEMEVGKRRIEGRVGVSF
jgi:hypothetical protein